jgi:hypothetical protein
MLVRRDIDQQLTHLIFPKKVDATFVGGGNGGNTNPHPL